MSGPPQNNPLCREALTIWQAGVNAVRGDELIKRQVQVAADELTITAADGTVMRQSLTGITRVCIVGAGKAAGAMACALERALLQAQFPSERLTGWINVPDQAAIVSEHLTIHPCRPVGVNEPTTAAIAGAEAILQLVGNLRKTDLCLVVLTGGGSALLPAPIESISLADKCQIARWLSAAGADIRQLNTVRKRLSRIKAGRLAQACQSRLIGLILSDVLGDPVDMIASGPTVEDTTTPAQALAILEQFDPDRNLAPQGVWRAIEQAAADPVVPAAHWDHTTNIVLANNQLAVQEAAAEARARGYQVEVLPLDLHEPTADELGRAWAGRALQLKRERRKQAVIGGGEPVVRLAPEHLRGKGGRNQQLVLAALDHLDSSFPNSNELQGLAILSCGTDGEDGPTDAAGAVVGAQQLSRLRSSQLDARSFLQRNDAYPLLEQVGGLVKTGPTQTNVCDVRVLLHDPGYNESL